MNSENQVEHLLEIVSKRTYYTFATVKAGLARDAKGLRLIGGHVTLNDQPALKPSVLDYETLVLVEFSLSTDEFRNWITELANEETGHFEKFVIPMKGAFMHLYDLSQQIASSNSLQHTPWACNVFRYYLDNTIDSQPPGSLPAKVDTPLYPDSRTAMADWLGTNPMTGDYNGSLVIFLPNEDARLGAIALSPSRISISIVPGRKRADEFKGKLFVQQTFDSTRPMKSVTQDLSFSDTSTEIELDFKPGIVYTVLFDKEGNAVDHQRIYTTWPGTQGVEFDISSESIERIIEQGEGETLEFKGQIGKNHREFAETMVAFANSKGGLILLGVDDHGDVKGIPSADLEKIEERITNFSRELCEPTMEFKATNVVVQEHNVVVVEVMSGPAKPYWLKNKGPIIRRGSTDRLMTPYELGQLQNTGLGGIPIA